jgi:NADPH:quinone reductase-like Zn-dependent oxidoreductase
MDVATAGAAPLAGIAALMSIDALERTRGDGMLIVGSTGGAGSFVVQLGADAGATVVAGDERVRVPHLARVEADAGRRGHER